MSENFSSYVQLADDITDLYFARHEKVENPERCSVVILVFLIKKITST